MLKKVYYKCLVLAAALFFTAAGSVQAADSTVTVDAVIQSATLAVSNTTVDFGTIITAGADSVVIDASGGAASSVATTPAVTNVTAAGSSGVISVNASVPNSVVDIVYPASIVVDDGTGPPANTMTMDQIATYSTPTPLTLDGTGAGTINVGGRLTIDATQAAGTYQSDGTDIISVNFQ